MNVCSVCGREKPWPGDCDVHQNEAVIVSRPAITVVARRAGADGAEVETTYDANAVTLVKHEARWKLSFLCSGDLVAIPAADVKEIRFAAKGAQHCMSCDGRLNGWPSNDYGYAEVVNTDTHERRPYPEPNVETATKG